VSWQSRKKREAKRLRKGMRRKLKWKRQMKGMRRKLKWKRRWKWRETPMTGMMGRPGGTVGVVWLPPLFREVARLKARPLTRIKVGAVFRRLAP
jgi:hypothetical protein